MLLVRVVAAEGVRGVGVLVGVLRFDPVQHRVVAAVGADLRAARHRLTAAPTLANHETDRTLV
ncbi:hypothetical protein BVI1335_3020003 [Burkholderia vietnamiensis]|nr:hypothetical protein BVI1335_3020003 [Burkholderia vietnamiensis]